MYNDHFIPYSSPPIIKTPATASSGLPHNALHSILSVYHTIFGGKFTLVLNFTESHAFIQAMYVLMRS